MGHHLPRLDECSGITPERLRAKHGLNRPKLRAFVEATSEDKVCVVPSPGYDVFPLVRESWRRINSKEVARCGLAETVWMVVCSKQQRLGQQHDTRLLKDLPDGGCPEILSRIDTACGHLGARLGMVSVFKDQQVASPLDVDHDSLTMLHLTNRRRGGLKLGWGSVRKRRLNGRPRYGERMANESEWAAWWRRQGEEELRLILWAAWDPIGCVPRDEYENYAPQVASLLRKGGGPDDVAALLGKIRTETIGLAPNLARDREVAEKLRDWYEHPFFGTRYPSPADFRS